MEKHEGEDQIGHCKRPKRKNQNRWVQAKRELNAMSTAISTMLPQQINSIGNECDDDAALHGGLEGNHMIVEMVSTKK